MKIKNKFVLMALLSTLNITTLGFTSKAENTNQEIINENKEADINNILGNLIPIEKHIIKALEKTEIYSFDNKLVGSLAANSYVEYIEELENIYHINYYGIDSYVLKDKVEKNVLLDISSPVKKIGYATEDINLVIPAYFGLTEDLIVNIPKLELVEIYDENQDIYVVKINDIIGYINKENIEQLNGTFVVVDISNQELNLYQNNEVILSSPVVTGKPSSPSDEGIFEIYNISQNRYLVGPNYKSYVDIMMKYNGGEGLHDAEYHKDKNGKKHGWRNFNEFGGDTYLNNGSHGCVNMPHDLVMQVKEYAEIGTKVLVKK